MKAAWIILATAMTAQAEVVTVCLQNNDPTISSMTLLNARVIATRIYAQIDIQLDWHMAGKPCPADAIHVFMRMNTPVTLQPRALAMAQPYEGTHVMIFFDRVRSFMGRQNESHVLAHVLAHEIGHILQGVARHSDSGIMKARWTQKDSMRLIYEPLSFTPADVELIHAGIAWRTRQTTASPADASAVE